jgi:hypothetical protein
VNGTETYRDRAELGRGSERTAIPVTSNLRDLLGSVAGGGLFANPLGNGGPVVGRRELGRPPNGHAAHSLVVALLQTIGQQDSVHNLGVLRTW